MNIKVLFITDSLGLPRALIGEEVNYNDTYIGRIKSKFANIDVAF